MKTYVKEGKTYAKFSDLTPWEENPRDIKPKRLKELVKSVEEYGQFKPIITTITGLVVGGNMRMRAYAKLGIEDVWVSVVDTDNPKEAFKVAIRDNERFGYYEEDKLAELAIKYELDEIEMGELYVDMGEVQTLEQIVEEVNGEDNTEEDEAPEPPKVGISKPGAVYQLGDHRVICGDATSADHYAKLMGGVQGDLYLTDPPYNVDYTGKTKDALKIENDKKDDVEFQAFLADSFRAADAHLKKGASFYVWHADSEGYNFRAAVQAVGWDVRQCLVWVKNTMVMGRQDYQWKHEPCLYGWKKGASHRWFADRKQTTVLNFDKPARNGEHPTMKPLALIGYQIANSTKEGDVVIDSFLGSGSTLIAAHQLGRVCYGLELDPRYVDVIRQRYAAQIDRAEDWEDATPEVGA